MYEISKMIEEQGVEASRLADRIILVLALVGFVILVVV